MWGTPVLVFFDPSRDQGQGRQDVHYSLWDDKNDLGQRPLRGLAIFIVAIWAKL